MFFNYLLAPFYVSTYAKSFLLPNLCSELEKSLVLEFKNIYNEGMMKTPNDESIDFNQASSCFSGEYKNGVDNISQILECLVHASELNSNIKMMYDLNSRIYNEIIKQNNNLSGFAVEKLADSYLTPQQAMNYLGMSKGTFDKYRYSSKIKIKGYQLDGKTWFKKSDLDRFMLTYQAKSGGLA